MIVTKVNEKSVQIVIDSNLYSIEVVYKCFYWYTSDYTVEIKSDQDSIRVILSNPKKEWEIENLNHKINTDLIDFKTRDIVFKETKNIREILIAKAFANSDEYDEQPPGDVNDPIGNTPFK